MTHVAVADASGHKNLSVGGAVTIASLIDNLTSHVKDSPHFEAMVRHLKRIAGTHVRNLASWAGNIILAKTKVHYPPVLTFFERGSHQIWLQCCWQLMRQFKPLTSKMAHPKQCQWTSTLPQRHKETHLFCSLNFLFPSDLKPKDLHLTDRKLYFSRNVIVNPLFQVHPTIELPPLG